MNDKNSEPVSSGGGDSLPNSSYNTTQEHWDWGAILFGLVTGLLFLHVVFVVVPRCLARALTSRSKPSGNNNPGANSPHGANSTR